MLEQGAPARLLAPGEIEIGPREGAQRVRGGRFRKGRVERRAEPLQRRDIDPQDQLVEIVERRVDRAERATRLGGEVARLEPGKAPRGDRLPGDLQQPLP